MSQPAWDLEPSARDRAYELLGRHDDDPVLGFIHFPGYERRYNEGVGTREEWERLEAGYLAREQYRLTAGLSMQPVKVRGRGPERVGNNGNGPKQRSACGKGHALDPGNVYVRSDGRGRECLICRNTHNAARATGKLMGRPRVDQCRNGHEMTEENLYYYYRDGYKCRSCRKCRAAASERRWTKKKVVKVFSAYPDQIRDTSVASA